MVGVCLDVLCFTGELSYFIHGVLFMFDELYTGLIELCLELRRILLKIHD